MTNQIFEWYILVSANACYEMTKAITAVWNHKINKWPRSLKKEIFMIKDLFEYFDKPKFHWKMLQTNCSDVNI